MPRLPIDYSKTIIYKLCCKDENITNIYVGSTTNFTSRKREHKKNCTKETSKEYNSYKYRFIRDNGGWNNWDMILIENFPCLNNIEARKRERDVFELLGATLNKEIPYREKNEYEKQYRAEGKHKITKSYLDNQEIVVCECGMNVVKRTLHRHRKNSLHKKNIIIQTETKEEEEMRIQNQKDKLKEYQKKYVLGHKDKINEYYRQEKYTKPITCKDCGKTVRASCYERHCNSNFHLKRLNTTG